MALALGFSGLVARGADFELSAAARERVLGALVSFLLSALCGLTANIPRGYEEPDAESLRIHVRDYWEGPIGPAAQRTAQVMLDVIARAEKVNEFKAAAVAFGLLFEALAFGLIAAAAWNVLSS